MFGGRRVHLIFHLKHNRDKLYALFRRFTVNVVSFAACFRIIVFFKIGFLKTRRPELVKLDFAMLFQSFPDHFGGHFGFQVFVELNLRIFFLEL